MLQQANAEEVSVGRGQDPSVDATESQGSKQPNDRLQAAPDTHLVLMTCLLERPRRRGFLSTLSCSLANTFSAGAACNGVENRDVS